MTGSELIEFIVKNHLENYEVAIDRQNGWGIDFFYSGLDADIDEEQRLVIL